MFRFLFSSDDEEEQVERQLRIYENKLDSIVNGDEVPSYSKKMFRIMMEAHTRQEIRDRRRNNILMFLIAVVAAKSMSVDWFIPYFF